MEGDGNTVKVGNANPVFMMGWDHTFSYKGFTLYFLLDWRYGGEVLSQTQAEMDLYGVSQVTALEKGDAPLADSLRLFEEGTKLVNACSTELDKAEQSGIGFVPTMGALHAGHRSLVERARRENATVVVSVFVNPTQFNDKNDLRHYPRTPEADRRLLEEAGADFVLMPSVEEIYPEEDTRIFDFGQIDKVMEGATRPGHFNGVAQVVSRLFDIVRPARAYFGEKDFQQIAVIKAMTAQLKLPVEIVECPIVRGEDGLALSSRNTLLDEAHRAAAPHIYATLRAAVEKSHEMTPAELKAWVTAEVERNPLLKVIYYQSVDALTMQEVAAWSDSERIQGCIAVQAGEIRLIDNICIRS